MTKIKVPITMHIAARPQIARVDSVDYGTAFVEGMRFACCYITENPIVPTYAQIKRMHAESVNGMNDVELCEEWQRRMFLEPEPEVPEEIKELMAHWSGRFNETILEAFRRGQKAGKP